MTTDPNATPRTFRRPALRREDNNDMVPKALIRGAIALVLISLALVSYARVTDRPLVATPHVAPVVWEETIRLVGGGAQAVTVLHEDGTLKADLDHGGFITVIQNGLQRERGKHGIAPDLPIRIVAYENGRLAAHDDLTGWSVELAAFGQDNRDAFLRLFGRK